MSMMPTKDMVPSTCTSTPSLTVLEEPSARTNFWVCPVVFTSNAKVASKLTPIPSPKLEDDAGVPDPDVAEGSLMLRATYPAIPLLVINKAPCAYKLPRGPTSILALTIISNLDGVNTM